MNDNYVHCKLTDTNIEITSRSNLVTLEVVIPKIDT
jgi:hypothetical protein